MGKSTICIPQITFHVSSPRCFGSLGLDRKLPSERDSASFETSKKHQLVVLFCRLVVQRFFQPYCLCCSPLFIFSNMGIYIYIHIFRDIMKYCISLSAHCLNFGPRFLDAWEGVPFFSMDCCGSKVMHTSTTSIVMRRPFHVLISLLICSGRYWNGLE